MYLPLRSVGDGFIDMPVFCGEVSFSGFFFRKALLSLSPRILFSMASFSNSFFLPVLSWGFLPFFVFVCLRDDESAIGSTGVFILCRC